jgi:hypothetical protein
MGLIDVGNLQNGLNADTSYAALNATILIPPGGYLPTGMPLSRNILASVGNYLAKWAALPGFGSYANGDTYESLPIQGVLAATTGASVAGGVYTGPPISNPWLNTPANTTNVTPKYAPGYLARTGARLAVVGVPNGGTTVKVGDFVGKGPTLGTTSINPYLISSGGTTIVNGQTFGQVLAAPIWTTLGAALTAPGTSQAASVWNTAGMLTTVPLTINPGGANQETVTPTGVTQAGPGLAAITISGTAGAASTVQITFNLAGYQGSVSGTGPLLTATTLFTISVPIPNGTTQANTTNLVLAALLASGFVYGAPANILGIGAGSFASGGTGAPASGALIYATSPASGTINLSCALPGTWSTTLLTYTVTVLNGTTQTFNGNAAGSATAVAFTGGVAGTFTATFQNAHVIGEPVVGVSATSQNVVVAAPGTAGMSNLGLVYVDLVTA